MKTNLETVPKVTKWVGLIRVAVRYIGSNLARSVSTLVIMIASVFSLVLLGGYAVGTDSVLEEAYVNWGARGHISIEIPRSELGREVEGAAWMPIDLDTQVELDKILANTSGIEVVSKALRFSGIAENSQVQTVFAGLGWEVHQIRELKGAAYEYDSVAGVPLWAVEGNGFIQLGVGLARTLGCEVLPAGFKPTPIGEVPVERPLVCAEPSLQLTVSSEDEVSIGSGAFDIIGLTDWGLKEINDRIAILPLDEAQKLVSTKSVTAYSILLTDAKRLDEVLESLQNQLRELDRKFFVSRWSDRAKFYHQVLGTLLGFMGFMVLVVFVVCFVSLLNTSYLNAKHMSRDMGTLRSIGFSRTDVQTIFMVQSIAMALLAVVVGTMLSIAAANAIALSGLSVTPPGSTNASPIRIDITFLVWISSAVALVSIAMLTSVAPIRLVLRESAATLLSSR